MEFRQMCWVGLSAVALATLVACTPAHDFTSTSGETFAPYPADHEVQVLDVMPDSEYVLLGYVESRGTSMSHAMPYLLKLARENGGDAIVGIKSEVINAQVFVYRGALIRYKS